MAFTFPALHASHQGIWLATPEGTTRGLGRGEAIRLAADTPMLVLNAPVIGQRVGYGDLSGLDLLELFAFLHPARFMVPTPRGLARACNLTAPERDEDVAPFLIEAAMALLTIASGDWPQREGAWVSAQALGRAHWPWAPALIERLKRPARHERWLFSKLPEWEEAPPRAAPASVTLDCAETVSRLAELVGSAAESRPGQRDYAEAATAAFAPRMPRHGTALILAEAGTGIGKTLGYLAPASLWAQKAGGTVWISTFTKALQRQLAHESVRVYRDEAERRTRVVTRKGRENYLCLLNLEDALQGGFAGRAQILAQLVARWAAYTADGDMIGGDLPGWLTALFRRAGATALTDRRGECVYAGCPHYRKCFIERAVRASAQADIVIANHALVMVNAARGRETAARPTRYVFDEGHHVFDAADSMFAAALTGHEAIEIRRWVIGPEAKARGRRRGLAARLSDVASYDEQGARAIEAAGKAARALPSDGWLQRLLEGEPFGALETLLSAVRGLVYARDDARHDAGYALETELAEPSPELIDAAAGAVQALDALYRPLVALGQRLEAVLNEAPDWMDGPARARIEGAISSLGWRCETVGAWLAMLARVGGAADPDFVDWLAVDRIDGREWDMGIHRHWLDPTRPFAVTVLKPAHGVLMTSATLRAGGDWMAAEARSGALHLANRAHCFETASPFDYAQQAELLLVTDVKRGDIAGLANAYARLILAAGGGTLGLFTAIRRLRGVHVRIADRLAREGLPLHAQHVDPIDTGTLVDIFRDDPNASLLGTDALRDGVDVPGESLRLVVMEGVPWSKPSVLHAARRLANGGTAYEDRLVRARLAQAFGRLIRRANDHGAFVLLSSAMPSRLLSAFPPSVAVARVTLDEAIIRVKSRLSSVSLIGQETGQDA